MQTLKDAKVGSTVAVVKLHGEGAVKRRIMAVSYTHLVMIMIFCAASGLVNLVTPTSAVVMGGLSICRIEWTTWLKFIAGFLAILLVISLVVLSAAIFIL